MGTKDSVICKNKLTGEIYTEKSSLTLWSTGVKPFPLVEELLEQIPEQTKKSGMLVDKSLLACGSSNIYAAGDCAVLADGNTMIQDLGYLFEKADVFAKKIDEDFEEIDTDGNGSLDQEEFKKLLLDVDSTLRNLPPTAQVAGQQGSFLAAELNGEVL